VIVAVLFQSGLSAAFIVMLIGLGLSTLATVLHLQQPSSFDLYLDASAWILLGLALSWVVARAVFAPGRITYHRIMGAILLYLAIGLTFVALYTFVGLLIPGAYSGMAVTDTPTLASEIIYFSFGTLTTAGSRARNRARGRPMLHMDRFGLFPMRALLAITGFGWHGRRRASPATLCSRRALSRLCEPWRTAQSPRLEQWRVECSLDSSCLPPPERRRAAACSWR
jgi:hypothetical protein